MTVKETADELAREYDRIHTKRVILSHKVADIMTAISKELEPIQKVMKHYRIPYRNPMFDGESMQGFVLDEGGVSDDNPKKKILYVFNGYTVWKVDAATDKIASEVEIDLAVFADTCNLERVKAGFDYVRHLDNSALQPYRDRNNEMAKFIEEARG